MSRRDERTNGYIGEVVSGKKLAEHAKKIYNAQYLENEIDSNIEVSDLLLIKLTKRDEIWGENMYALVCDEGVGWEQQSRSLINVPTNLGGFGLYNGSVKMSVGLIKSCLTGETADIADFVRVFGDRLDSNVSMWQGLMEEPANV
jgi:hypothetical protein